MPNTKAASARKPKFRGDYLVELREKKGLTQPELGASLVLAKVCSTAVSKQMVSQWELGLSVPGSLHLIGLGKVFGVPADSFFEAAE